MAKRLEVRYVRSVIGYPERQRRTIEALGLRKLHASVVHDDNPTIRGMLHKVRHLTEWRELEENEAS